MLEALGSGLGFGCSSIFGPKRFKVKTSFLLLWPISH